MEERSCQNLDIFDRVTQKRALSGTLRILIPVYATYFVLIISIFLLFLPHQQNQLFEQKKETIRHLTDSVISLLAAYDSKIKNRTITPENARKEAANQIRNLKYGEKGKGYFWITDMNPIMIMHPHYPELEGRDLTLFKGGGEDYPFVGMVAQVMEQKAGYVQYHWQENTTETYMAKISFVKGFPAWGWIVGTGIYEKDVLMEIKGMRQNFIHIFLGVFVFILFLSVYITTQVFRMDKQKRAAEQARAIEELRVRQSEERYRLLAENATDVILILEVSTLEFSYISPSFEVLLGFKPKEFIGRKMGSRITRESFKNISGIISEELDREMRFGADPARYRVLEMEMLRKDGSKVWAQIAARFLRNPDGVPDRILGIVRDVTDRKLAMEKLKESEEKYRLLFEGAQIMISIYDRYGCCLLMNRHLARLFGGKPEAYSGKTFKDLHPEMAHEYLLRVQNVIDTDTVREFEDLVTFPGGRACHFLSIVQPVKNHKGQIYAAQIISQDITEKKKLEKQIQQSHKMEALGTLAGGIAHDFNNILSSMMGFTELAKLQSKGDAQIIEHLDQVLAGGLRARDLVKHILSFSRKADAQEKLIALVPLLKECLKFLRSSLPSNIEIRHSFMDENVVILADPTQIHQVIMNLFANAAHAMKEKGGILDVRLDPVTLSRADRLLTGQMKPGPYVQIIISDTGCGIPKPLTEKIFEPFFTTKKRGEGTGMGLSTAYGIIKSLKGHIGVYSEPNKGATFKILIPRQAGKEDQALTDPSFQAMKGQESILLVDDDPPIVEWSTQLLSRLGYRVKGFCRPEDAMGEFKQNPSAYDLVITDLSMPGITGLELSNQMTGARPDLPVIICTGFSENLTQKVLADHGISSLVMKPMIAGELVRTIRQTLDGKHQEEKPCPVSS